MPADMMRVGGQDYLVSSWLCTDKHGVSHVWRTWQRECVAQNKSTFYGRPFVLEDQTSRLVIYTNQFGEIQGGIGADIQQAYLPLCGT